MGDLGSGAKEKGLFRAFLGGEQGTVAAVFTHLAAADVPKDVDERLRLFHARFDLPGGRWVGVLRFFSVTEDIFAVLTDCSYATVRHEHVLAEGRVEFHFLLEGPVELSLPHGHDATAPSSVSLIVCSSAGNGLRRRLPAGRLQNGQPLRSAELLEQSFGLNAPQLMVQQLLRPADGTIAVTEQKIDLEFLRVLRDLFEIDFDGARGLPLACARIIELLALSADAIDRSGRAEEESIVFTARELAMFTRAREVLSSDFSESQTIPKLARKLGTNATKLKSGFRLLYGTTIFAYRNRHRMDRAMQLLVAGELPIATVAHAVGFHHQASFTSAFRAHFGLTPKQARQRVTSTLARWPAEVG